MSTESNYGSSDDRDVDVMPLGEALSLELLNRSQLDSHENSISESPTAATIFESSTRPTLDGSCLLATPACPPSLAYRISSSSDDVIGGRIIEALRIDSSASSSSGGDDDDDDAAPSASSSCAVEVLTRCPLGDDNVSGVFLTVSDDGRLIAVACSDGSLRCYDVTSTASTSVPIISHRWTVADAHSHVSDSDSGGRIVIPYDRRRRSMNAAADAGPVRSLQFSPLSSSSGGQQHLLLLVDSSRGSMSIYDAASSEPIDLLSTSSASSLIDELRDGAVSCACWCPSTLSDDDLALAVGRVDSSIRIYSFGGGGGGDVTTVRQIVTLDAPDLPDYDDDDDDDNEGAGGNWCCTHLDCLVGSRDDDSTSAMYDIAAGFCRVTPEDDGDEPDDEEDDDDPARHEVSFFVGTLTLTAGDSSSTTGVSWSEDFGEMLCPFFSLPRGGRHVYFTSHVPTSTSVSAGGSGEMTTTTSGLLLVASNLSSDVGVLAKSGDKWEYLDLEEGRNATTPTDEEDEYTYPTGLVACRGGGGAISDAVVSVVLLGSTDGSASVFSPKIEGSPDVFAFVGGEVGEVPALQPLPVEESSTVVATHPPPSPSAVAPVEEEGAPVVAPAVAPAAATVTAPLFGVPAATGGTLFGSASTATAFGGSTTAASAPTAFGGAAGGFGSGGGGGFTFGNTGGGVGGGFSFGGTGGGGTQQQQPREESDAVSSSASSTTGAATSTTASSSVFGSGFGMGTTPQKKPQVPFGSCFGSSTSSGGLTGSSGGGFAALAAAAASPTTAEVTSEAVSALSPPPFGAFVKDGLPPTSSRIAPGMVKPLFSTCGGCGTSTEGKTPSSEPQSPAEGEGEGVSGAKEPKTEPPQQPTSSKAAQRAGEVFDSFDNDHVGTVPASTFEDMVDDLGEGFHGDELERQLRSVLDGGGGGDDAVIGRDAFVRWYVDLVEGGGGDGGDDDRSSSSSDASDVAEERAKAEEKFQAIAGDSDTISRDEFPRLMKSMGTTYCEEEHRKTLKKITGEDGRITRDAFVNWYVDWIFRDDDEDDEDEDGDEEDVGGGSEEVAGSAEGGGAAAADQGWGGCFSATTDEGSWKCECCMVQNKPGTLVCAACETPRPGAEGEGGGAATATTTASAPAPGAAATTSSSSGIGSGGFTFGGAAPAPGPDAASATSTAAPSSSGVSSAGFTFGGSAPAPGPDAASAATPTSSGIGSAGFTFGGSSGAAPTSTGIGSGGFTFGGAGEKTNASVPAPGTGSVPQPPPPSTGIGAGGFTFGGVGASGGVTTASGSKATTTTAPAPPPRSSSSRATPQKEPSDAALRAMRVFDEMDTTKTGRLEASRFEELLDELGEGFHGDELSRQLSLVVGVEGGGGGCEDGTTIERESFVAWYVNLVDGVDDGTKGDGSSSSSLDTEEREEREEETENAIQAFDRIAPDGSDSIPVSDFPKLMKSMGTTYCEEEHRRTIKKISSAGRISRDAFVAWYVHWILAGDEEDESDAGSQGEEEEEVTMAATETAAGEKEGGASAGWGTCFGQDEEGSWKCDTCMVLNKPGTTTCAACESPRPGHEGGGQGVVGAGNTGASDVGVASSGIGSGGFKFGGIVAPGAALSDDKTGKSTPAPAAAIGSGGFVFGGSTTAVAATTEAPKKPADDESTLSSKAPSATLSGKMARAAAPAASKAGTSSAYPPMSAKAPSKFSGSEAKTASPASAAPATAKPATSGGYPPMAGKAPTPFGGAKKATSSSSSSGNKPTLAGGYPPMSTKAPSPSPFSDFGSRTASSPAPAPAAPKSAGSGGFQPPAGKTPTPFSGTSSTTPAGGIPPTSTKAPSPFSSSGTKAASSAPVASDAPAPAIGSGGYPPMAGKAPTPFNAASSSSSSDKPAAAGAYPPMSMKAPSPSPFSSTKTSSGGAFPPMSTKAPSPFAAFGANAGASSTAPPAPKPAGGSAVFPPMAGQAPTPFSSAHATTSSSMSSNKAASAIVFPPPSTKASSPFSGFGGSKAASASSSASAAPAGPKTTDGSGGYPPMAGKAPTPSNDTKAAGAFPPMSSKAPSPFSSFGAKAGSAALATGAPKQADAPTPFAGAKAAAASKATPLAAGTSTVSKTHLQPSSVEPPKSTFAGTNNSASTSAVRQPPPFKASSPYEAQVYNALTGIDSSLSSLRRQRVKVESSSKGIDSNTDTPDFQHLLQLLVEDSQKIKGSVATAEESINTVNQRSVFLLSQRDDIERQVKEARRLLDEPRPGTDGVSSYSQIIQKQPLDLESEKQRRRLASMSVHVQRGLVDLRERVRLSQRIFHLVRAADDDRHIANCLDKVRDVQHDDHSSPRHQIGGKETMQANKALFSALKIGYDRAKEFESTLDNMETQVKELSKTTPFAESSNKQGAIVSFTSPGKPKLSRARRKGPRIAPRGGSIAIAPRPLDLSSTFPAFRRPTANDTSDRLSRIESEVRKIASAPDYVQVNKFARSSPVLPGNPKGSDERQRASQWRQGAGSQLMNTPDTICEPRGVTGAHGISTPSYQPTAQALFRSPSTQADSRYGYRSRRSVDRAKGDQLVASIPAGLREINASDAARKALASFGTTPERVSQARDTVARGAQLPSRQSSKASSERVPVTKEACGKKTAMSDVFPPLSTKAPTPFAASDKGAANKASAPAEFPPMSAKPPMPFSKNKDSKVAAQVAESSPLFSQDSRSQDRKTGVESPKEGKAEAKSSINKTAVQSTLDIAGGKIAKDKSPLDGASSSTAGFSFGDVSALGDALTAARKPPLKEIEFDKAELLSSKDGGTSIISAKPSPGQSGSFLSPPTSDFGKGSAPQALVSVPDVSQPDYRAMLVSFYERHNPAKVGDVDHNLEKYKGKEAEMFAKLATKYNVPNPLQGGGKPPPSPAPAPVQTSPFASLGTSVQLSAQSDQPDYRSLLVAFYQKYNPTKVGDVESTLIKYKGKETEMFAKLANKYRVPNPLMTGGAISGQAPSPSPSQGSPFLAATPASPTPFGAAPSPSSTPFGSKPPSPGSIPFGSKPPLASSPSPFGSNTSIAQAAAPSSPFGAATGTAATFGPTSTSQSPFASSFGQASGTPPSLPFGASAGSSMTSASPFSGAKNTSGTAFGSSTSPSPFVAAPVAPSDQSRFGGRNPRDILVSFYQQYNASKVAEVDKLLAKYAGNEEQLFRNLAKKYNLDEKMFGISPAAPTSSGAAPFASAQPNAAQQSTFGGAGLGFGAGLAPSPSPFSSSPSPGGFGQPSSLGGNSAPAVGSTISSSPFGASASSGQTMGFGSLAASSGPGTTSSFSSAAAAFGGGNANSAGGFGSGSTGFGGTSSSAGFSSFGTTGGFGGPTPFGGARR